MSIFQTSYSQRPSEAVPGQVDGAYKATGRSSRAARGEIKAGYGVFRPAVIGNAGVNGMLDPGQCYHIANPGVGADVDAIITAITSSTSVQSFSGTALNGVVGGTTMQPPRNVTLVLSNSADWDATNATLIGVNHLGQSVTETIAIPNGGNTTVTSTNRFMSVTSLSIPAQSGTGGTATVGISALASLTLDDFLGVAIRKPIKSTVTASGIYGYPGITSTLTEASYVDGEVVPVLEEGLIWVYTEEAVLDRDPVYVRVAAGAGGSVLGAFRNDADSASCVIVTGARFRRNADAGCALARFPYA
jgi:hypothetical protein